MTAEQNEFLIQRLVEEAMNQAQPSTSWPKSPTASSLKRRDS